MDAVLRQNLARVTRRQLFGRTASGVGVAALASLMQNDGARAAAVAPAAEQRGARAGFPNFAPRAKRVVYLWQGGGPSHIDLFDPKPTLAKMAMQDLPESVGGGTRLSTMTASYKKWPCLPSIKPFRRYGQSGMELGELV